RSRRSVWSAVLTTSPPLPTHVVPRVLRPDRLPRRARSGSLPRILVDQPVHARPADHLTAGNCRDHGRSTRRTQLQAAMRSVPVVVLDVLGQDRLQVPPTNDQQPVQALAADTGDPAFAPSIRVRGPHRCSDHLQTFCPEDGVEGGREVAVTIVDQEAGLDLRFLQLPGQVPRLLDGPAIARVLAAGGEDDAPASQLQEEKDVQALQEHRVHREVVAGQDRLAVGTLGSVARGFLLVAVRVGCGGRGGGYGCWWWRLDGRA